MTLAEFYSTEAYKSETKEKIIEGLKFLDLRYVDAFELLFLTSTAGKSRFGKNFDVEKEKQLEEIFINDFGYDGIIFNNGKLSLTKELDVSIKNKIHDKNRSNTKNEGTSQTRNIPGKRDVYSNHEIRKDDIQTAARGVSSGFQLYDGNREYRGILLHERKNNESQSPSTHDTRLQSLRGRRDSMARIHDSIPRRTSTFQLSRHNVRNYTIKDELDSRIIPLDRFRNNLEAIKVVTKIFNEKREATYEEKETLIKYSGFGGLTDILYVPGSRSFCSLPTKSQDIIQGIYNEVKKIDPDEQLHIINSIKSSSLTAYYTPPEVIRGIYDGLEKINYKGGRVLEPSMGIGHFLGCMPDNIKKNSSIYGIEKDQLSGLISQYLYPDAKIKIKGLEEANMPMNYFNMIIGNIPFGDIKIFDPTWQNSALLIYKFAQQRIHNYFIAKNIELAAENGLIVLLTTTATLDTPANSLIREYITEKTQSLGAIRLPNNTFCNTHTKVTSDILFLRKFRSEETKNQQHNIHELTTDRFAHENYSDKYYDVTYNNYFKEHPEMLLGIIKAGGAYSENTFTLIPNEQQHIREQIKAKTSAIIPHDLELSPGTDIKEELLKSNVLLYSSSDLDIVKEGNIVIQDGEIGKISLLEDQTQKGFIPLVVASKYQKRIPEFIKLRNSLGTVEKWLKLYNNLINNLIKNLYLS